MRESPESTQQPVCPVCGKQFEPGEGRYRGGVDALVHVDCYDGLTNADGARLAPGRPARSRSPQATEPVPNQSGPRAEWNVLVSPGGSMETPRDIATILLRNRPRVYCCPCLAQMLTISERPLREAAQMLVLQAQARLKPGDCASCGRQTDTLQLTVVGGVVERESPKDSGATDPI
jgi:hypothetical protein